jgi:four helix bundle protein
MATFRDLIIWQKSMQFVTDCYLLCSNFPKEEMYALTSQIKRSAISIPSNIAEGYGRRSDKEFIRFLNISISSLFEIQTQIEIAYNLKYISTEQFTDLLEQSREIERIISSFIQKVKQRES